MKNFSLVIPVLSLIFACDNVDAPAPVREKKAVAVVFAGSGEPGLQDGIGTSAKFKDPRGLALAPDGSLYVADFSNNKIRKISPQGDVTSLPDDYLNVRCLGAKSDGTIYAIDYFNTWKINPSGERTKLAGGNSLAFGMTVANDGNLLVADVVNHRVAKLTIPEVEWVRYAGGPNSGNRDGAFDVAQFFNPTDVSTDANGILYVSDEGNQKIRKVDQNGNVSSIKDGFFSAPQSVAVAPDGTLYIADRYGVNIVSTKNISTLNLGITWKIPGDIVIAPDGTLFVSDMHNHRIIKITFE